MPSEIRTKTDTKATFTQTLASLGNGSARQTTMVSNSSNRPSVTITYKIKLGTSPTAGTTIEFYLLRGDDASSSTYRTDGAGASDAAITIKNAQFLGAISLPTGVATGDNMYFDQDTSILGDLGPEFGIAVKNNSGVALDSTEGNHLKGYYLKVPEAQ